MNRERQIEEMAVILTDGGCTQCNCDENGKFNCLPMYNAELLYNAGYRKQGEGEWKILKMGDGEKVRTCSVCLISQTVNVYKGKVMFRYCPYCGAKMKGGAE